MTRTSELLRDTQASASHRATNRDLLDRRMKAVPRGIASAAPVFIDRAENAEVWDVEGNRYIDFAGGIGALNVGHRHPKVLRAVNDQLARFTHTAFQVSPYESYVELAERLNAIAPFRGPAKSIFFTTGAEAAENAVKIARAATGRSGVIAFSGGFHGRTMLAMALTGKVKPYKRQFGTMPGPVFHLPFPDKKTSVEQCLQALRLIFAGDADPESIAAIIIEPVQGEGGFRIAPPELLTRLRAVCDEHRILLIADEIQTGFARTGRMFAIEHAGVEPDLICVAKSIAGGFPLSGVVGRAAIMDSVDPGGLGGTYAGPPLACAAALAVLEIIEEERLLDRSIAVGLRLRTKLEKLQDRADLLPITDIRNLGGMVAFDVVIGAASCAPDAAGAKNVCARALENGLIVLACGTEGHTIRILVPLTASDALIDEGMARLEGALRCNA